MTRLGGSRGLGLGAADLRHTKTTTQPMRTAMEVVRIMTNWRFSRKTVAAEELVEEMLEGSSVPLIMADMRSRGEILRELESSMAMQGE